MKEWKINMAEIVIKNHDFHVLPFEKIMEQIGKKHVNRQDAQDIINHVLKNTETRFISIEGTPLVKGFFTSGTVGKSEHVSISRLELEMLNAILEEVA